jgi:hypothetical protein
MHVICKQSFLLNNSIYLKRPHQNPLDSFKDLSIHRDMRAGSDFVLYYDMIKINGALHAFMSSRVVSTKTQLAVHNVVLLPTLMYGSESWVWQKKTTSRVNAVDMPALRSMIGKKLSDRVRNEVIKEECGMKEDVVTKIEKNMLRWFGHVERMNERILTKEIYKADLGGNAGRGIPRRTFLDQIGEV